MPQSGQIQGWRSLRLAAPLLILAIALVVAGCSASGGGGSNYSLGLAGSTSDHPSQPPTIQANGPGGTYAFVYDNQIWLRQNGQAQAKQLTHLVLSKGATLLWGPLIWSPSGRYIAYSLVENLTPDAPTRTSGPLYYVDTQPGNTFGVAYSTAGTGSIYGHTYAWWSDYAIFYSSGSCIMLYDLGDCDPRVWQAISPFTPTYPGSPSISGGNVTFSDIAITNTNRLFATQITLQSPGSTGVVGSAAIYSYRLPPLDVYKGLDNNHDGTCDVDTVPGWLNQNFQNAHLEGYSRYELGVAYADPTGNFVTGAWQLAQNGSDLAGQFIDSIDTKAGTVSSHFYVDGNGGVLRGAGKYPIAAHPAIGISSNGRHVSFAADKLYVDNHGAIGDAGGSTPPAWGGDVAVATQVVSQSTDVGGAVRSQTNVIAYSGGTASAVLIAGAQDLSWQP